eukprot:TRINITY_DN24701_c0_g1_i1.p1 TRINITY_DN24701_c0_g1~~TRINITY_DN24701_c0_g1_i1.p1  ORF type:complete len:255 (-),score=42.41 TRINITY_DN24701_c0_g1_i1:171-857(-)
MQAAGRTDAGVHARGQVVQFFSSKHLGDEHKSLLSLNSRLPRDIRVLQVNQVNDDFDVRRDAISKTYNYQIITHTVAHPIKHRCYFHYPFVKDWDLVREGAQMLEGEHNFELFCNQKYKQTRLVRSLNFCKVQEGNDGEFFLVFNAKGFLYRQVRHMVGALLAVGRGTMCMEQLRAALDPRKNGDQKNQVWSVVTANGLFLEHVEYPDLQQPMVMQNQIDRIKELVPC